jgi:hypothetical protein
MAAQDSAVQDAFNVPNPLKTPYIKVPAQHKRPLKPSNSSAMAVHPPQQVDEIKTL